MSGPGKVWTLFVALRIESSSDALRGALSLHARAIYSTLPFAHLYDGGFVKDRRRSVGVRPPNEKVVRGGGSGSRRFGLDPEIQTMTPAKSSHATIIAGIPAHDLGFYRRIRFSVGDPAALITLEDGSTTLILRDIEMDRARRDARADAIACPADFAPAPGLSSDRAIATAQAAAEFLRRAGVQKVRTDRGLPMLYAHHLGLAGVTVECDPDMGVLERRAKDEQEVGYLREAQRVAEQAVEMVCRMIASSKADAKGALVHDGTALTSERIKKDVDVWLLRKGFSNAVSIVAGGPQGGDCHDRGSGPLFTAQPVIVDIFPTSKRTLYNGDCTRTVVHGREVPPEVARMHATVVDAKRAAIAAIRAGVSGDQVHAATTRVITSAGFQMGLPKPTDPPTYCGMVHGTGHGVGLEVHEPPLIDKGGPVLIEGDCLTIEPGLYCHAIGGIRVEDMVIVRDTGCDNLNSIHEGLNWE